MKILVADDAAFMRLMLRDILTKAGHEVVGEADNGENAVKLYRELKPDVVTMDITMPNKDGISALKDIKEESPEAHVVMCSAMGQQSLVLEALKAGAEDFIIKPFQGNRVVEAVSKLAVQAI